MYFVYIDQLAHYKQVETLRNDPSSSRALPGSPVKLKGVAAAPTAAEESHSQQIINEQ